MSLFFCDEMEIEHEIHSVLQCQRYQTYRDNFFTYICRNVSKIFLNNDAVDKFIFLMKLNYKYRSALGPSKKKFFFLI